MALWKFGQPFNKQDMMAIYWIPSEPAHEIMVLFVRRLILQTCMRSHPVGLDVWFVVGLFIYFHPSCVQTAKALAELRWCTGLSQPSLVAYLISTISSWASSIKNKCSLHCNFCQKTLCRKTYFAVKVPQWPYNDFKNKVMVIKT